MIVMTVLATLPLVILLNAAMGLGLGVWQVLMLTLCWTVASVAQTVCVWSVMGRIASRVEAQREEDGGDDGVD